MSIKIKCLLFIMKPIIVIMMRHGQVRLECLLFRRIISKYLRNMWIIC